MLLSLMLVVLPSPMERLFSLYVSRWLALRVVFFHLFIHLT